MSSKLNSIYHKLFTCFGPQYWWPGETPFEVAVGAILTQNTNWTNVEKAINNLKNSGKLNLKAMRGIDIDELASLIRPAGYFNVKAKRLKNFIALLADEYKGSMKIMKREDLYVIREKLLLVNGIGPETADSIMLYALEKPVFVIDAYTKRILSRHNIMDHDSSYNEFQELFQSQFQKNVCFYKEYHALLVHLAKNYCRTKPACAGCPLEGV
jgi:endonuclease-3 related protein